MINPETIEFMGINILLLFLFFFIQSKNKKNKKKKLKKNSNENLKFYNRFFLFSFLFRWYEWRKYGKKAEKDGKTSF